MEDIELRRDINCAIALLKDNFAIKPNSHTYKELLNTLIAAKERIKTLETANNALKEKALRLLQGEYNG